MTTLAREHRALPPELAQEYLQSCEIAIQRCQQQLEYDEPGSWWQCPCCPCQRGHGINMLNNKLAVRYPQFHICQIMAVKRRSCMA